MSICSNCAERPNCLPGRMGPDKPGCWTFIPSSIKTIGRAGGKVGCRKSALNTSKSSRTRAFLGCLAQSMSTRSLSSRRICARCWSSGRAGDRSAARPDAAPAPAWPQRDFVAGVSAIDGAVGPQGKAWGQPLYRLLGGPARPGSAGLCQHAGLFGGSCTGLPVALAYQAQGYPVQKWSCATARATGRQGWRKTWRWWPRCVKRSGSITRSCWMPSWAGICLTPRRCCRVRAVRRHLCGGTAASRASRQLPALEGGCFGPAGDRRHVYTRWQVRELSSRVRWIGSRPTRIGPAG